MGKNCHRVTFKNFGFCLPLFWVTEEAPLHAVGQFMRLSWWLIAHLA